MDTRILPIVLTLSLSACARATAVHQMKALPHNGGAATVEQIDAYCRSAIGSPRVEQVAPNVWVAIGYDLANTILIRTSAGNVIVDTGTSPRRAQTMREALLRVAPGPTRAVVFTHSHIDHVGGASVWVEPGTEIWATDAFRAHLLKQYGLFAKTESRRGQRQFGRNVPDALIPCSALGMRLDFEGTLETGMRMPTRTFSGSVAFTVGDTVIELHEAHGETHDHLFVWLPQTRTLMPGDDFYRAFPNLYTIRGTSARPVDDWIRSLDAMRRLRPDVLAPSHTAPIRGADEIGATLRDYRDAIQWVRDEVIRRTNAGESIDRIVTTIGLPAHLANKPYLWELYGQVDWSARAIYDQNLGWFDEDAIDLYPLPPTELAQREIGAMGGADAVLRMAGQAVTGGDVRWGASLLQRLRLAETGGVEFRHHVSERLAAAYTTMAAGVLNTNGRSYLLQSAIELTEATRPLPPATVPDEMLAGIELRTIFEQMTVRLQPGLAMDVEQSVIFDFPDAKERYIVTVRRGVAELIAGQPLPGTPAPLVTVTVDAMTWKRLATKKESPAAALASGRLKVDGSLLDFSSFMDMFDRSL